MLGEINNDFYCSGNHFRGTVCNLRYDEDEGLYLLCEKHGCPYGNYTRKYPTPEQFKEDYGDEYPDEGAVYALYHDTDTDWFVTAYWENAKDSYKEGKCLVVCACTPFGKPDKEWRP